MLSLSRNASREVDRIAIEEFGMSGLTLMENAGQNCATLLNTILKPKSKVTICCGRGNNGGDGFVIARRLRSRGHRPTVLLFGTRYDLSPDAAVKFATAEAAGVTIFTGVDQPSEFESRADWLTEADWIVDALLGTGPNSSLRPPWPEIIERINSSERPVFSVDLPSGLHADSGEPLGSCVRADITATFVTRKRGFNQPAAADWTGEVHVIDIGLPQALLDRLPTLDL